MSRVFKQPEIKEFEQVKQLVNDFWLDDTGLQPQQFQVLSDNGKVIAFGRLREHADATELCTMGVAGEFQKKGFGKEMVNHLLCRAKCDVYLVTVIPDFFKRLGFDFAEQYPDSIQKKIKMCVTDYHVDEPYFVMKWEKK
jgi:N-acetylglutamate synthase-like GNAT family acetyltransferase